jgi:hypothetical protein
MTKPAWAVQAKRGLDLEREGDRLVRDALLNLRCAGTYGSGRCTADLGHEGEHRIEGDDIP